MKTLPIAEPPATLIAIRHFWKTLREIRRLVATSPT
jgi:hypothetical protein